MMTDNIFMMICLIILLLLKSTHLMKPSTPTPDPGAALSSVGDNAPLCSVTWMLGHWARSGSRMRPAVWKAPIDCMALPGPFPASFLASARLPRQPESQGKEMH